MHSGSAARRMGFGASGPMPVHLDIYVHCLKTITRMSIENQNNISTCCSMGMMVISGNKDSGCLVKKSLNLSLKLPPSGKISSCLSHHPVVLSAVSPLVLLEINQSFFIALYKVFSVGTFAVF
jgi:hypothetical protein